MNPIAHVFTLAVIIASSFASERALANPYPNPPVIESDEFYITTFNDYTDVWDDRGSGATRNVTILKPQPPAGFYILGHVAVPNYDVLSADSDRPYTIAIKPKPGFENLIRSPSSFEWVYDDSGTDADRNLAMYTANCGDASYVALGAIAHPGGTDSPGDPNFVCISKSALLQGSWHERSLWDDSESDGDHGVALWTASFTHSRPSHSLVMVSNAFWPTKDAHTPNPHHAYAMSFKFNHLPNPVEALPTDQLRALPRPVLSGPQRPTNSLTTLEPIEYSVPFFIVNDPMYEGADQWVNSPTYTIVRTVGYKFLSEYDNVPCTVRSTEVDVFHHTQGTGLESEDNWSHSLGQSLTITTGVEVAAEPLGVGATANASVAVELSHTYDWGGSTTRSTSREEEWEHQVPKGTYSALFARTSTYVVKRSDGTEVEGSANSFTDTEPLFVDWAPDGWDPNDPCGSGASASAPSASPQPAPSASPQPAPRGSASAFPMSGETALVRRQKYPSPSGNHYLIFQDDGNLVVYTAANGFVWGLNDTLPNHGQIDRIVMQSDGNLVASAADGGYIWSALHAVQPPGTALTLSPTGALQIISPSGAPVWSSLESESE